MTERERLIELIKTTPKLPITCAGRATGKTYQTAQNMADHLLNNHVFVAGYSIDPPRICDTCIHYRKHTHDMGERLKIHWCAKFDNIMKFNDFCSYWEGRNNEKS